MVGAERAEPITPVEPTASASEDMFSLVSRSDEAGSSVIHVRVVHIISRILSSYFPVNPLIMYRMVSSFSEL